MSIDTLQEDLTSSGYVKHHLQSWQMTLAKIVNDA